MTAALESAFRHAQRWIDGLNERPVGATLGVEELRRRIATPMPSGGELPATVIDALAASVEGGLVGSPSGRFFGWVIGGALPSALAADWLVSAWDQNSVLHECAPATSVVEETAGEWLKELLDLPRDASFAFTTGCQLAHVTALASARHAVLERVGWDVEQNGLVAAPAIQVLVNAERHGSIERAVRHLGIGRAALRSLDTDALGRVRGAALERALSERDGPTILVLNAADLNVGACDDFTRLIPTAHAAGAWVHIDGAFGLFARASRAKRHLVEGVEGADSWATDAHKWLNVPFDCGVAIVRDREAHRAAMTLRASYIEPTANARDSVDWTPEWSRRARGVPVYAALRELGREGVESLVDRTCEHCAALVRGIGALDGAFVVAEPTLNQGLVRFALPGGDGNAVDADTDEIVRRVNATGEAFFSATTWRGRRAMRVSVVNWRTSACDVERAVAAVELALRSARAETRRGDGRGLACEMTNGAPTSRR